MRQLKNIFLALALGAAANLNAQDSKTSLSQPFELKYGDLEYLGYDNRGYYVMERSKDGFIIKAIDKNMNVAQTSQPIEKSVKFKDRKRHTTSATKVGKNILVFSEYNDTREDMMTYYVQKMDAASLSLDADLVELYTVEYKSGWGMAAAAGGPSALLSPDQKTIFFYGSKQVKGEKDKRNFYLSAYDENLKQLWTSEIDPAVMKGSSTYFRVDNFGNMFISSEEYGEKRKKGEPADPSKFYVYALTNKGKDLKEFPVEIPGLYPINMYITLAENGNLIGGGYYSEKNSTGYSLKGVFYWQVDAQTKKTLPARTSEFTIDFIKEGMSKKQLKKAEKKEKKGEEVEMIDYTMRNIIAQKDGGIYLVGENYGSYTYDCSYYNGKTWVHQTCTGYYANDIIVTNFKPDGSVNFNKRIEKNQQGSWNSAYSYEYAINDKGELFFIYNDDPKNLFLKDGDEPDNFSAGDAAIMEVKLDKNGNITKRQLFKANDDVMFSRYNAVFDKEAKQIFFLSHKSKKKNYYGLIKY